MYKEENEIVEILLEIAKADCTCAEDKIKACELINIIRSGK